MLIAMAGLPGSGKSTLAAAIGAELRLPVVSVDPIEAAILRAGIDAGQPTGLAAYLVAEAAVEPILASGGLGVVLDAVNAVGPARDQWVGLAERQGRGLRFLEVHCSDPDLHHERLEARRRLSPPAAVHAVEESLDEWAEWDGAAAGAPRLRLDSVHPLPVLIEQSLAFLRA